jgi:long-chain fatty acid transport protein
LNRTSSIAGAATLAALVLPSSAHASGFAAARFGGEHGSVTTTNPTALYYNPAGIAFSTGTHLFGDGTIALRHATWEHAPAAGEPPDAPGSEGANYGKATLFNVFGGPMLGATTRIGDLAIGASLSVPFGGRATWTKNDKFANDPNFPLAADGVQRWHIIEGALTFIYLTAGAAYRIGPVSFGVSGNFVLSSVKTVLAKNPTGVGDPDNTREGRSTLDVSGKHGSFGVGAMLEALPNRLWIGASYQAQPALGPMKMNGTLTLDYAGGSSPLPVTMHQALPDVVRLGARFRPSDALELRMSGDLTRWSVMQTQCVSIENHECAVTPTGADATSDGGTVQNLRRRWKDTYAIRAGLSGWISPAVEFFGGLGFETAATPDETLEPGIGDADNISTALGGRFELGHALFVAASYTHIQYLNRDNTGKSELSTLELPTRRPDGGGKYTQWIGLVNFNIEKQF